MERKVRALEEKLKAIEGSSVFGLDTADMCLVPRVKIPAKFKVPDFEKYKGISFPKTHVRAYYRKMAAYSGDERLLMHFFQDSLRGASLEWYMQLQNLTQKSGESFKEFTQRWRELAARVQPPLLEKEIVDMFMSTLQGPYLYRLVASTSSSFSDLVVAGERIESMLKGGKIEGVFNSSTTITKKTYMGFTKKKEWETNATYYVKGKAHAYHQVAFVSPIPY
ncbi:uncharacterized protein LOC127130766 [Lathyrus oleraceus]|uniref:uncharacterized protein LOC127130766 n=1 Tax=Pisum sativum TaxID=3888 RepID=UPI0021D2DCE2|nr:uncharacterized protein LOC127130766 [Pisum sativum]